MAAAASAFGSYLQYQGQQDANEQNIQLAADNRAWQHMMSSTAHQRETKDLIAAGLNPMLSSLRTGASTPPGNVANVVNPNQHSAEAARQTAILMQSLDKMKAETDNIRAETELKKAEMLDGDPGAPGAPQPRSYRAWLTDRQARLAEWTAGQVRATTDKTVEEKDKIIKEVQEVIARTRNYDQQTINRKVEEILLRYDIPGARNVARHQTDYEKYNVNVKPFIHDAGELTNSAHRARQMFRPDFTPQRRR